MMPFDIDPILPLPFFGALVGGWILLSSIGFYLSARRHVWRCLLGAVLLALCLNPRIESRERQTLPDIALILEDRSPSQQLGQRQDQTERAKSYLRDQFGKTKDLEFRIVQFGEQGNSRLATDLQNALNAIPKDRFAGAVLISDGQIQDVDQLPDLGGPLHVLLTGDKDEFDRAVDITQAPQYAIVDEDTQIRFRLKDHPHQDPIPVTVSQGTTVIDRLNVIPGEEQEITFRPSHRGTIALSIKAPERAGEISTTNNKATVMVNAVREKLNVLLISGRPHPGQRTWRNILRADPSVQLVHFTILRPSEKEDFTPINELSLIAFPVRELFDEKLDEFDLVIFDRYILRNVLTSLYFDNIATYVRNGGALLVAAGPDFAGPLSLAKSSLSQILPALPTGMMAQDSLFRPTRSALGTRHPVSQNLTQSEDKWGRWARVIKVNQTTGHSLMNDDRGNPLLIVDHLEKGRIAMLLSDQFWLWARGVDGGGPHTQLTRQLIHWLMKEPELEENRLILTADPAGFLEIQQTPLLPRGENRVQVTLPNGDTETVELTPNGVTWQTKIATPQPGLYRVTQENQESLIVIGTHTPEEYAHPLANADPLAPYVKRHHGTFHWIGPNTALPRVTKRPPSPHMGGVDWIGFHQNQSQQIIGVKHVALLPFWLILTVCAGLIIFLWWRENA